MRERPSGAVGTLVSSLVDLAVPAGQVDNVTDWNSGALVGIAVTAADTTNGTWFYSTNNGASWNALGAVAGNNARLLAADANTRLYFQPNANFNGAIPTAITFRAWDQTSGTNGGTADSTANGGTTAFSTATDTASLTVNAVNDAPVLDRTEGRPRSDHRRRDTRSDADQPGRLTDVDSANVTATAGAGGLRHGRMRNAGGRSRSRCRCDGRGRRCGPTSELYRRRQQRLYITGARPTTTARSTPDDHCTGLATRRHECRRRHGDSITAAVRPRARAHG